MGDLRATLTGFYQKHGELTPQIVVDEARPKGAPLHDHFEWNDEAAGEEWRRHQAAQLIRSVRVEFSTDADASAERKYVRAFHSLREAGDSERGGYAPVEELFQDDIATKLLLRQCEREIAELKRKYGHLVEFRDLLRSAVA